MSAEKKIRILTWAVIVLAIMTFSIIATIVYKANFSENDTSIHSGRFGGHWRGGDFIENIDFSEQQKVEFRKIDNVFREDVTRISTQLDSKREALFAELEKAETDTAKCRAIATEIGTLHRDLKLKTCRFYLDVKKICTPGQQEKLRDAFAPIFNMDEGRHHGGGGRGHRGHYGWH